MVSDKNTLRKQILEKRAALTPEILERSREEAAVRLLSMEEYRQAGTVMAYMDFRSEVPTGAIIRQIRDSGKKLVLPLTDADFRLIPFEIPSQGELTDYLTVSSMGIAEPNPQVCKKADLPSIDLVIVPGSVFDENGNRIGYGKGCYDRFLDALPQEPFKLALAYDLQVLPHIPCEPTDVRMDRILTISTK